MTGRPQGGQSGGPTGDRGGSEPPGKNGGNGGGAIASIVAGILEGIALPRQALRRVIDQIAGDPVTILGLIVVAYLIQALAVLSVPGANVEARGPVIAAHIGGVLSLLLGSGLTGMLVFGIGRLFGGSADLPRCLAMMAWFAFVTSFLWPIALIGLVPALKGEGGALASLLLFGWSGATIWIFASHVAEVHGFRSTLRVAASTVALALAAYVMVGALAPTG